MRNEIDNIRKVRIFLLNAVQDLNAEQMNKIPEGFNNNIIWNLGHLVSAQQGICYKRAEKDIKVSEDFFNLYKSGSKPERLIAEIEINEVKQLLMTTLDELDSDIQNNYFEGYKSWRSRYDLEVDSIDKAVNFLQFHEGLHFGYISALKRVISSRQ